MHLVVSSLSESRPTNFWDIKHCPMDQTGMSVRSLLDWAWLEHSHLSEDTSSRPTPESSILVALPSVNHQVTGGECLGGPSVGLWLRALYSGVIAGRIFWCSPFSPWSSPFSLYLIGKQKIFCPWHNFCKHFQNISQVTLCNFVFLCVFPLLLFASYMDHIMNCLVYLINL